MRCLLGSLLGPAPLYSILWLNLLSVCEVHKIVHVADLVVSRPHPAPSVNNVEDTEDVDTLVKAWRDRAVNFFMQSKPMRKEALSLGIGKVAAYCRVYHTGPFL